MHHPYADLIGMHVEEQRAGFSKCTLEVTDKHRNPHNVAHGAVLYALADTGMGAALYPTLDPMQICATVQLTMNYFKPVVLVSLHAQRRWSVAEGTSPTLSPVFLSPGCLSPRQVELFNIHPQ